MTEFLIAVGIAVAVIAAVILFVLSLRGTLTIGYRGEFFLYFRVLFIKIKLFPLKKRKKRYRRSMSRFEARQIRKAARRKAEKRRARREAAQKKKPEPEQKPKEQKKVKLGDIPVGMIAREIIDILSVFTEVTAIVVKRFTHHLRIKVARLKVRIATEDPAVTAVTYGAASQIINVLLPILSEVKNFDLPRRREFDISADFTSTAPDIDVEVSFSLRTWHIADVGLRAVFGAIGKYVGRKGGAQNTIEHIGKLIGSLTPSEEKDGTDAEEPKNKKANNK